VVRAIALLAVTALALTGCSATHRASPTGSASAGTSSGSERGEPASGSGDCGRDLTDDSLLLPLQSTSAIGETKVERSASVVALTSACDHIGTEAIPASVSCDPGAFPWTVAAQTQRPELYTRGVDILAQASFRASDEPRLREVILSGHPRSSLASAYVAHARRCGAQVLSTSDGRPTLLGLGGPSGLLLRLDDGRVIGLQAQDGRRPRDLLDLMTQAERTAAASAP
jgi:hypothetical protein